MKLITILKWLFTYPPTSITWKVPDGTKCDYCGAEEKLWNFEGVVCICQHCMKKIADKVLDRGGV